VIRRWAGLRAVAVWLLVRTLVDKGRASSSRVFARRRAASPYSASDRYLPGSSPLDIAFLRDQLQRNLRKPGSGAEAMGRRTVFALALLTTFVTGCGSGPAGPGVVPPSSPQLTCGDGITVDNVVGTSQPATYTTPAATGGASPVSVSCSPASGTSFPLGTTTVTCSATDAQARQTSCSFTVTLRHRELAVTKFLAFGDSMTAGENGRPPATPSFIDLPNAYPTFLQQLFTARIPGQQITVINAGVNGEKVTESNERLKDEIRRHQPEVLLVLQGINDINGGTNPNAVVSALRDAIRTARDRGVQYVFVSTLLPVARDVCTAPAQGPTCRANFTPADQPAQVNQLIRSMVPANGASLVDPYDQFLANRATYIDTDGLHLRPAGNQALATAFWNRIVEVIPGRQLFGF